MDRVNPLEKSQSLTVLTRTSYRVSKGFRSLSPLRALDSCVRGPRSAARLSKTSRKRARGRGTKRRKGVQSKGTGVGRAGRRQKRRLFPHLGDLKAGLAVVGSNRRGVRWRACAPGGLPGAGAAQLGALRAADEKNRKSLVDCFF